MNYNNQIIIRNHSIKVRGCRCGCNVLRGLVKSSWRPAARARCGGAGRAANSEQREQRPFTFPTLGGLSLRGRTPLARAGSRQWSTPRVAGRRSARRAHHTVMELDPQPTWEVNAAAPLSPRIFITERRTTSTARRRSRPRLVGNVASSTGFRT